MRFLIRANIEPKSNYWTFRIVGSNIWNCAAFIELIFRLFKENKHLKKNNGRGRVRCKHLFWDHHFESDFRSLIRDSIESKSRNQTFCMVESPGKNIVNPNEWRCRELFFSNIFVFWTYPDLFFWFSIFLVAFHIQAIFFDEKTMFR